MAKHFLYIPSLSAGSMSQYLKKDTIMKDGTPYRFYSDEFPKPWKHPCMLLTAGHLYKKMNIRSEFGLDKTFVMGDSGGFQIANGTLKWSDDLLVKIFDWLEKNSDVAINLDIPPKLKNQGKFTECLAQSIKNFEYFDKHQSGSTLYLNVLHGITFKELMTWYDQVKHFNFGGWSFGTAGKLTNLIAVFSILLENNELDKSKFLHVLGVSKLQDFIVLSVMQKLINESGSKTIISADSSSPGQYAVYGKVLYGCSYRNLSFQTAWFKKAISKNVPNDCNMPNPLRLGFMNDITPQELYEYKTEIVNKLTLHNLFMTLDVKRNIESLTDYNIDLYENIVPHQFFEILNAVKEIFTSKKPINTYMKFITLFSAFDKEFALKADNNIINSFFNFK